MTNVATIFTQSALVAALISASLPASAASEAPAACTAPSAAPRMLTAIPAEMPIIANVQGLTGHAVVRVDLDRDGFAHNPSIMDSTGSAVLDNAALAAAVEQRFTPEVHDCASVDGTYAVEVDFGK